MTTNFDILERAEKVELLSAELYAALARRYADDPTAVQLFTRLRDEEQQHAARVRMLAAQSRRDTKLLGKIDVDPRRLDDVLLELASLTATVQAGHWELDLARTRHALLELEGRCARAHVEGLQGLHESLRRFFEQLAEQDKAHEELLRG
jgi:hypothetical protein